MPIGHYNKQRSQSKQSLETFNKMIEVAYRRNLGDSMSDIASVIGCSLNYCYCLARLAQDNLKVIEAAKQRQANLQRWEEGR
jgi:hypothetical protein